MISVSGESFKQTLGNYIKEANRVKLRIFTKMPIFRFWNPGRLGGIMRYVMTTKPLNGKIIMKKGEYSKYIYVILGGEAQLYDTIRIENKAKIINKLEKRKPYMEEERTIMKLGVGSSIGEESGFNEKEGRSPFSVRISSNTSKILSIPKDILISNITIAHELDFIKKYSEKKMSELTKLSGMNPEAMPLSI